MPTKQEALEALNTMSMGCGYDWDAFAPAEDTLRAYIESAEKDAERLDSGCIMTSDRDEWGEHKTQRVGRGSPISGPAVRRPCRRG